MNFLFRAKVHHRRHVRRGVPRDLPPHLMRDIGLDPWVEHTRPPTQPHW